MAHSDGVMDLLAKDGGGIDNPPGRPSGLFRQRFVIGARDRATRFLRFRAHLGRPSRVRSVAAHAARYFDDRPEICLRRLDGPGFFLAL
jgi:hypothetical protein